MSNIVHYEELQTLLDNVNASEAHGMLIAFLCANQNNALPLWIKELSLLTDDALEEGELLVSLYKTNREQLGSIDFSLELLLPKDESFHVRAPALISWCHGFLYGIGAAGLKLDDDALEFTNDLIEFTRTSFELEETDETEELLALEEIIEFVRMGAILVYHQSLTA